MPRLGLQPVKRDGRRVARAQRRLAEVLDAMFCPLDQRPYRGLECFKLRTEELLGVGVAMDPFVHLLRAVQRVVDAQAEHVAAAVGQLERGAVEGEAGVFGGGDTDVGVWRCGLVGYI